MSLMEMALNDVACNSCIHKIKRQMQRTQGIEKVKLIKGTGKLQINFNEKIIQMEEINRKLNKWAFRTFD